MGPGKNFRTGNSSLSPFAVNRQFVHVPFRPSLFAPLSLFTPLRSRPLAGLCLDPSLVWTDLWWVAPMETATDSRDD